MGAVLDVFVTMAHAGRMPVDGMTAPSGEGAALSAQPPAFSALEFPDWPAQCNGESKLLPARHQLSVQGQHPECVYFLHSGTVKLVRLADDGDELILGLRSKGCVLDASPVTLGTGAPCSIVTVTPCRVFRVGAAEFRRLAASDARFLADVNKRMAVEILADVHQQVDLRFHSARQRLERFLSERSPVLPAGAPGQLALKRTELAQLLGITPEHLSRLLATYRDQAGPTELAS